MITPRRFGDDNINTGERSTPTREKWPTNIELKQSLATVCLAQPPVYFSHLSDDQLISLFRECPPLRFELSSVIVKFDIFGRNRKLFGTIQASGTRRSRRGLSSDPATLFFHSELFNRKYEDSISIPDDMASINLLHDISFVSIPTSLSVQIIGQLNLTVDDDDDLDYDDDDDDDEQVDNGNSDQLFKFGNHYPFDCMGDWGLKGIYDAEKKDDDYRNEVDKDKFTTDDEDDDDSDNMQLFKVCDEYTVIDFLDSFAQSPYGGSSYATLKAKGGSLQLNYVVLKYPVDAYVEVEFDVATSQETKIVGSITASYGGDFDYGLRPKRKHLYKPTLFETKPDVYVKPGKINLIRSVLAVPAPFSLIIDADLRDLASGDIFLKGVYEFPVPCDCSNSVGLIDGSDCSLELKVEWKLPFKMLSFSG